MGGRSGQSLGEGGGDACKRFPQRRRFDQRVRPMLRQYRGRLPNGFERLRKPVPGSPGRSQDPEESRVRRSRLGLRYAPPRRISRVCLYED